MSSQAPEYIGLGLTTLTIISGSLLWLFKALNSRPDADDGMGALVEELRDQNNRQADQIEDLQGELRRERDKREQSTIEVGRQLAEMSRRLSEVTTELAVTKAQLTEAYRRLNERPNA
jgi:septal ring factor EnvC (AmiA/AmiB activator)